jgi:disulfide bond formation protein DsbB
MDSPKTPSDCGAFPGSDNTLPLFREEAVAAQRRDVCGDVIRIRPLSAAFFALLIFSIALIVFAFLCWARYARQSDIFGILLPSFEGALSTGDWAQ